MLHIDPTTANELVKLVWNQSGFHAIICDDRGTIIADSAGTRVGTVHGGARQLLTTAIDSIGVGAEDAEASGGKMKEGFNLAVKAGRTKIGTFGVAGPLAIVEPIAKIAAGLVIARLRDRETSVTIIRSFRIARASMLGWRRVGARLLLVGVACGLLVAPALGQSPGGRTGNPNSGARGQGGMAADGQRPDGGRGGPMADAPLSPAAIVHKQLDRLEDELKLTADQQGSWGAYADNLLRLADLVERSRFEARTANPEQGTAAQQLERIAVNAQSRSTLARTIADQGQGLYALLAPAQRRVADYRLWQPLLLLTVGIAPAPPIDATSGLR